MSTYCLPCEDSEITWVGWLIEPNTYSFHLLALSKFGLSALVIIRKTVKQCVKEAFLLKLELVLCMPMDRIGFEYETQIYARFL